MDKKQIIVSTVAGLAVLGVGYFVWQHEQSVSAANAQAQQDANQAQLDQLSQMIQSLPSNMYSSYGGGASYPFYLGTSFTDTGSSSLASPAGSSSDLQAILQAFFPSTQPATTTSPAAAAGASGTTAGSPPTSSTTDQATSLATGPTSTASNTQTGSAPPNWIQRHTARQSAYTTLPTSNNAAAGYGVYNTPYIYSSGTGSGISGQTGGGFTATNWHNPMKQATTATS